MKILQHDAEKVQIELSVSEQHLMERALSFYARHAWSETSNIYHTEAVERLSSMVSEMYCMEQTV